MVDVDDLVSRDQIVEHLLPLKEAVPALKVTAYAIPNRLGSVAELVEEFPWIVFGIHGFEHTQFECAAWSDVKARRLIQLALDMGYAGIFKAPNWVLDIDVEQALRDLGVVLHHHEIHRPRTSGLRCYPGVRKPELRYGAIHTHILRNPVTDFIAEHPFFKVDHLRTCASFMTPFEMAQVVP